MLAVDVLVRVDRAVPGVGVVAGDDVRAAVARHAQSLFERARRPGRLHHHVRAHAVRQLHHLLPARLRLCRINIYDVVGPHVPRQCQSVGGRAHHNHPSGAGLSRECRRAQSHRAGALHHHRVTQSYLRALDDVHRCQQPAATTDVGLERHRIRHLRDDDARLQIHLLCPAAEQPLGGGVRDAIHAARQAARRRPVCSARQASSARAMNVEEREAVTFLQGHTQHVAQRSARFVQRPRSDVPRDDRIRHTRQPPMPQMNVRPAHFGERRLQQRAARRQIRFRKLSNLNRHPRRGHHSGQNIHDRSLTKGRSPWPAGGHNRRSRSKEVPC